jgi:hypothetical protein
MALVDLPERPTVRAAKWQLIDFGATMPGGLGGPSQRLNRLGNRWRLTVAVPPMDVALLREWQAKLNEGVEAGGVRLWVRQLGLRPGSPGVPRVNGADQSGKTLIVDGLTPGYTGRIGQFVSVVTDDQRFGFKLRSAFRADAAGEAELAIEPALRVEPGDNDVVEIGKPFIEGKLAALPSEDTDVSELVAGFEFAIEESR